MENELYTILFIASFILLLLLISVFKDRISIYYVLLFGSILITNFGYMQLSDAVDIKMAVYANQTTYLGSSFCPFFLLMCIADLTKQKIKRLYQMLCIIGGSLLFVMVSTISATGLYYKSIELVRNGSVSVLVKEYGPLHILSPMYFFVVVLGGGYLIIKAIRNNEEVSYITCAGLILMGVIVTGTYVLERLCNSGIEYLPLAYVFAQIGVFILLGRVSLHDITVISAAAMAESLTYGFILFDSKGRFLGSDDTAKIWFSELRFVSVDKRIRSENTELLRQIGAWIRGEDNREIVHFELDDKTVIEARHSILKERKTKTIHCLYLRDDTKQQEYLKLIEEHTEILEQDVEGKNEKIHQIRNDIIRSMASIVENRDNNTGGHIARTSDVVRVFVNHLRVNEIFDFLTHDYARRIIKAAPLHDFGKIGVPDSILNKPGRFTDEEYEIMKTHSAKGAAIVEKILQNVDDTRFRQVAVNVAHYHHEKWDGKGYPEGLAGGDIPFEARVMALADVFDALVSKRVYKDSLPYDKAFSIIEESGGNHFDPVLCTEFLKCRPLLEELYDSYVD